jgi:hypothetical protein
MVFNTVITVPPSLYERSLAEGQRVPLRFHQSVISSLVVPRSSDVLMFITFSGYLRYYFIKHLFIG